MLLRAYLPKLVTALFGGLFIAAGLLTFGNALIFDRIFIGILIFTAIACRKNINILGIIVILALERIFEESLWFLLHDLQNDVWYLKILVYCSLAWMLYKLWYDPFVKIALTCLVLSVGAEMYWDYIDYERVPHIYWHNIIIGQSLLVRYFLFSRIEFTERLLKKTADSINLDWFIHQITRLYIVVEALNIFEYLLRHVAKFSQIQLIYDLYPYVMQSLATFTLWIVFKETEKLINSRLINA